MRTRPSDTRPPTLSDSMRRIDAGASIPTRHPVGSASTNGGPFDGAEPADWGRLWALCLRVRAGSAPAVLDAGQVDDRGDRHATKRLRWSPATGWSLAGPWSPGSRALFALVQPLLDADPPAGAPAADGPEPPGWVLGQLAQSLDGFVAMPSGESCYISGDASLRHLHRLRALCDAVIVGAGTAAADDPRLTTRLVPGGDPVRVVVDPALRLAPGLRLFSDGQAPTLCLHDANARPDATRTAARACQWLAVPGLTGEDGGVVMAAVVRCLRARGLRRLFFEGGAKTVSRCMAQGVLDRLHLTVAPLLIGQGRRGLRLPEQQRLADCLRPRARVHMLGEDIVWDLALREAARPA